MSSEWVCCACASDADPCGFNSGRDYCETVRQVKLPQEAEGQQLVQYLAARYRHSAIDQWVEHVQEGRVSVDGTRTSSADLRRTIEPGMRLCYHRPPWKEPLPHAPYALSILYEDADVLVVLKPSGLAVMPSEQFHTHTIMAVLDRMFAGSEDLVPSPAHRLGVGTSGALLCAKSARAKRSLPLQFQNKTINKEYRALVTGTTMPDRFTCTQRIGLVDYPGMEEGIWAAAATGKAAVSHCRVLERRPGPGAEIGTTLLAVEIETGRPHQIRRVKLDVSVQLPRSIASAISHFDPCDPCRSAFRIHVAAAGHPLVGDPLYEPGGTPVSEGGPAKYTTALPRDGGYMLHSASITFDHPAEDVATRITVASDRCESGCPVDLLVTA